jgi:hypothetical protein
MLIDQIFISDMCTSDDYSWKQINFAFINQYKNSKWQKGTNEISWNDVYTFHLTENDLKANFKIGLLNRSMFGKPQLLGNCIFTLTSEIVINDTNGCKITKMLTLDQLYRSGDITFRVRLVVSNHPILSTPKTSANNLISLDKENIYQDNQNEMKNQVTSSPSHSNSSKHERLMKNSSQSLLLDGVEYIDDDIDIDDDDDNGNNAGNSINDLYYLRRYEVEILRIFQVKKRIPKLF